MSAWGLGCTTVRGDRFVVRTWKLVAVKNGVVTTAEEGAGTDERGTCRCTGCARASRSSVTVVEESRVHGHERTSRDHFLRNRDAAARTG